MIQGRDVSIPPVEYGYTELKTHHPCTFQLADNTTLEEGGVWSQYATDIPRLTRFVPPFALTRSALDQLKDLAAYRLPEQKIVNISTATINSAFVDRIHGRINIPLNIQHDHTYAAQNPSLDSSTFWFGWRGISFTTSLIMMSMLLIVIVFKCVMFIKKRITTRKRPTRHGHKVGFADTPLIKLDANRAKARRVSRNRVLAKLQSSTV